MKSLVMGLAAVLVAAGCTTGNAPHPVPSRIHPPTTGTITGVFTRAAGPVPAHPTRGAVTLIDAHGHKRVVRVNSTGRFTITASPGRYTLTGPSDAPRYDCQRIPLTVAPGSLTHISIECGISTD
jgi:hypothetical protein